MLTPFKQLIVSTKVPLINFLVYFEYSHSDLKTRGEYDGIPMLTYTFQFTLKILNVWVKHQKGRGLKLFYCPNSINSRESLRVYG